MIPFTDLRASPFLLTQNAIIVAKVRAQNQFGFGHYSEPNLTGATILVEPHPISQTPQIDNDVSSLTQIKLDWSSVTGDATGGSPIDSYLLNWDGGSNGVNWIDLKGYDGAFDTQTTFTVSGLEAGRFYKFRLKAHNVHGWSTDFSPEVTYQAADQPNQPYPATATVSNLNVRIAWIEPEANHMSIDAYRIYIANTNGDMHETSACDGANALILSQTFCDVSVNNVLRQAPFNLQRGQMVVT